MPIKLRTSLSFLVALVLSIFIAGCGGGAQITPPAAEGFTNSNLNGTYSFSATGTNAGGFFTFVGSFTANGSGSVTGGTIDISSPGTLSAPVNSALTGTYNVLSDGRTQATLTATAISTTFVIDFVLLSNTNGLVIRFDNNGTASGSLDLQNANASSLAALAGSFAFNLSGIDSAGQSDSTAGAFTFDSSGNISTGIQDVNDAVSGVSADTPISGGTVVSPTNGRGTITLNTSIGALHFAFYPIDTNHIRMISTDTFPAFSGDAFRQATSFTASSAFPAGSSAFTLAGASLTTSGVFPLVAGGVLTADGNGNILAGSTEDINLAGSLTQNIAVTGTYNVAATGRGTLNLSGSGQSFAIYPTQTGGVLMLDLSAGSVDGGTALQQQGSSFSNSSINGTYGLNLSGVNLNENGSEIDGVGQFTANGNGSLNGAFDLNNLGALSPSGAFNGTYSISANGRGTGTLNVPGEQNLGLSNFGLIYYVVSSSRVLFIEADPVQPSVGVFATQTM